MDIKQFSEEIAGLFSSVFKPILDIILFTNQLRLVTGWQGPTLMYSYFFLSALIKRIVNRRAKFGKVFTFFSFLVEFFFNQKFFSLQLVAGESAREGYYRTAHQRLITNSEEIAFYDGSARELVLVDKALSELFSYSRNHRYVRAVVDSMHPFPNGYFTRLTFSVSSWRSIID